MEAKEIIQRLIEIRQEQNRLAIEFEILLEELYKDRLQGLDKKVIKTRRKNNGKSS